MIRASGQRPAKRTASPLRVLYAALVQLHPRSFRQHFGGEMLSIFDHTASSDRLALVGDAVFSLLRQRLLRPGPQLEACAREYLAGVPMFVVFDDDPRLTRNQWMGGAALSLLSFAAVGLLIAHGGSHSQAVIGSRETSQSGVRVHAGSTAANLNTEVTMSSADILESGPIRRLVAGYFEDVTVLDALDLNHDLIISADEIANAPQALRSLDANGDGALDAEECGKVFAGDFMGLNPVLAVLDANHDGLISGSEISNAAAALERLDSNHDGRLTAEELLPDPLLKRLHELLKEKGINHEQ
jgi:Ca2+-binding EF-hand superfamily protein